MLDALKQYINDRYGSRRGLINHFKFLFQHRCGNLASLAGVDWTKIDRFIFICHGNICRSPLAEAVARQRFNLNAESFGLDCTDGVTADPRAIAFANANGLNLAEHRARHIKNYQPRVGDLIVGMEPAHIERLMQIQTKDSMLTLAGLWASAPKPYIHDPFSTGEVYFSACEVFVVDSVERMAKRRLAIRA